ncbi:MAG: ATP-binding protein, partial [Candidatus Limnocylindrales bacterium]
MGMNTGEAVLGGDNYTGLDLVRAARIMAAAHGGQVLVSDATRSILSADLPEGAHLRALGSYRLKDIPEPERLHQLEAAGLRPSFPPPRALDVRQAHLPQDATSFIGRGPELASVADLLLDHR